MAETDKDEYIVLIDGEYVNNYNPEDDATYPPYVPVPQNEEKTLELFQRPNGYKIKIVLIIIVVLFFLLLTIPIYYLLMYVFMTSNGKT